MLDLGCAGVFDRSVVVDLALSINAENESGLVFRRAISCVQLQ
jgi:hypothetical protein